MSENTVNKLIRNLTRTLEHKQQPHEPKGIKFFDSASKNQMILVNANEPRFANWIFYQYPTGQWVSMRLSTEQEIEKIRRENNEI